MGHASAITKHTVALNVTVLNVDRREGLVPTAIYAVAWTAATCTFALKLLDKVAGADVYKASDDSAVTLVDDKWTTIPEVVARKLVTHDWQIILASAEAGGPFVCQIAWAPEGGE